MKLINIFIGILLLPGITLIAMEPMRKSTRVAHLQSQARIDALISPIAKQPSTQRKARKNRVSRDPLAPTSSRVRALGKAFNSRREAAHNLLSFSESELTPGLEQNFIQRSISAPEIHEFMDIINEERDALLQEEELLNQTPLTPDYSQEYDSAEFDNDEGGLNSAIINAAEEQNLPKLQQLLDAGIDINTKSYEGKAAINYAVINGDIPMVRFLVERGANLEIRRDGGQTPLLQAAEDNHTQIVLFLIASKANVQCMNKYGLTSLIYAVQNGNLIAASALLKAGARVKQTVQWQKSARDMAERIEDEAIKHSMIELLNSYSK